ncbi:MAG: hypothetical protein ACHQYP_06350 [Nitrospiria bacterium]
MDDKEVSISEKPVISGWQENQVNITHLLDDFSSPLLKGKFLDALAIDKGRLEIKNGSVILSFLNLKDKEEFLVNLNKV